jgi:hypothetical protein
MALSLKGLTFGRLLWIALSIFSFLSKRLRVSQLGFRGNSGTSAILIIKRKKRRPHLYNSRSLKDLTL